jgi:hypothetical protein
MQTIHNKAYGSHITSEEWVVIQQRYKKGVTREMLMREHRFSRSAWRQHLQHFQPEHERAKIFISQRMENLYRSKTSTPIHIVATMLEIESSIVEDLWPIARRNVLKDRNMQITIRDLAKTHAHSKTIREILSRTFGYRDWDKMRKSIVWHKDIYREIVEIIAGTKDIQDGVNVPHIVLHPDIVPPRPVVNENIVGREANVEYLRQGQDIMWRFLKNTQVYYYCPEKGWSKSSAYRRIQEAQQNTDNLVGFRVDK